MTKTAEQIALLDKMIVDMVDAAAKAEAMLDTAAASDIVLAFPSTGLCVSFKDDGSLGEMACGVMFATAVTPDQFNLKVYNKAGERAVTRTRAELLRSAVEDFLGSAKRFAMMKREG